MVVPWIESEHLIQSMYSSTLNHHCPGLKWTDFDILIICPLILPYILVYKRIPHTGLIYMLIMTALITSSVQEFSLYSLSQLFAMLNRSNKSRYSCLVPDHRRKVFIPLPLSLLAEFLVLGSHPAVLRHIHDSTFTIYSGQAWGNHMGC